MTISDEEIDRLYIDPVIAQLGRKELSGIPVEQVRLAHVTLFAGTLINGGLLAYLIDTKGEYVPELQKGLAAIREPSCAPLMQQALKVFRERLKRVADNEDFRIALSGDKTLEEAMERVEKELPDATHLYKKGIDKARSQLSDFVCMR